jgi:benzoyl-CoA reductase subunit D
MGVAGIDVGARTTKAVIMQNGKIVAKRMIITGIDLNESAEQAFNEALKAGGINRSDISTIVATGMGRKSVSFANEEITEVSAAAKGASFLFPTVKTVIEVGAEEARAVRCESTGKVTDFALNEKCAAGAGSFVEAMARALEIKVEEMAQFSLAAEKSVPMNAQCVVFAESEVVSLVHSKIPKTEIARSVHEAMASRITSMTRTVGVEKDVALVGGIAMNPGFVKCLESALDVQIMLPEEPEYIGALGAAISATV